MNALCWLVGPLDRPALRLVALRHRNKNAGVRKLSLLTLHSKGAAVKLA
jgi:hypothetical protein